MPYASIRRLWPFRASAAARLSPMMSEREIACLQSRLAEARVYLEFGCGGSTRLAAESAVERIHSVDTDGRWIDACKHHPSIADSVAAGRIIFTHVEVGPIRRFGYPLGRGAVRRWPDYYLAVWDRLPTPPDLVFIDGRWRIACAVQTLLRCLPETTILFHDFTLRERYAAILRFAEQVETVDTLAVLKARADLDPRDLALTGFAHLFDTV